MSDNPVLDATVRYARACRSGNEQEKAEARKAVTEAKLRRAVDEALAAFPPLDDETKSAIAHLLTHGGA